MTQDNSDMRVRDGFISQGVRDAIEELLIDYMAQPFDTSVEGLAETIIRTVEDALEESQLHSELLELLNWIINYHGLDNFAALQGKAKSVLQALKQAEDGHDK